MSLIRGFIKGISKNSNVLVSDWADANRVLPQECAAEYGPYRTSRTPYIREIQDKLSSLDPTREIVVVKGTQLALTEMGNNWFFYIQDIDPGPCLMVLPTEELSKKHVKAKINPSIKHLRNKEYVESIPATEMGKGGISFKTFPGGFWGFAYSNSPSAARSLSIKNLYMDDVDGYPASAGQEGDPVQLFVRRTDSFKSTAKILYTSTPVDSNTSRILRLFHNSSQARYHVPCPFCGTFQVLVWGTKDSVGGLKFSVDDKGLVKDSVKYMCKECSKLIPEDYKGQMLAAGCWIHQYPERDRKGYHISGLYSPLGWVSWEDIAREYLESKEDILAYKVWVNTRLGEGWKGALDKALPSWVELKERAESYKELFLPLDARVLTAGIDVQKDRVVIKVKAWGRNLESWIIWYGAIYGDLTSDEGVRTSLDEFLDSTFKFEGNGKVGLKISMTCIDSGFATQDVYDYVRNTSFNVRAIKGSVRKSQSIVNKPTLQDVNYKGEKIKGGIKLWSIGVDTAKMTIYNRLGIVKQDPNRIKPMMHFYKGLPDEYFKGLLSERLSTRIVKGRKSEEWIKIYERNEPLDCEVYALAAAYMLGVDRWDWDKIDIKFENMEANGRVLGNYPKRVLKSKKQYSKSTFINR